MPYMRFNHPEMLESEIFIGNYIPEDFEGIGLKTKRKGETAYNEDDQPFDLGKAFPVFVQRSELEENGVDPDKFWE